MPTVTDEGWPDGDGRGDGGENGPDHTGDWFWFIFAVATGLYLLWDAFVVHANSGGFLSDMWYAWCEPAAGASLLASAWVIRPWKSGKRSP